MSFESDLRKNKTFDIRFGDRAVNVGDDEPRILRQKVDRKRDFNIQWTHDEPAVVQSGLKIDLMHLSTDLERDILL